MKRVLFLLAVVMLPSFAEAQPNTAMQITAFRVGSSTPATAAVTVPLTAFVCAAQAAPAIVNRNPNAIAYEPVAGTWCVHTPAANGVFSLLGFDAAAQYVFDGVFVNVAGPGSVVARTDPFTQPGEVPTVAPPRLRVIRSGS